MYPSKDINIRAASMADLERIAEIERSSFPDPYPRGLLKAFFFMPSAYIVAEAGGRVVGYAIGIIRRETLGHIVSIAVDPLERRHGVGGALLNSLIDKLGSMGAKKLRLEVRVSNSAAKRLYAKAGFKEKGKIRGYYQDGEEAAVFVLNVAACPQK